MAQLLLVLSILAQIWAIVLAWRLMRASGRRLPWALLILAFSLRLVRMSVLALGGRELFVGEEALTLAVSLAIVAGMYEIAPLFRDFRRAIGERDSLLEEVRKEAAAAEEGRRTLEALLEFIPEGITIADAPQIAIRRVSRYGQELTGRAREAIEGITVERHAETWGIFHPDGTPAGNDELPLTRAVRQGEVARDEEWVLRRPDGSEIVILCNAGPIRDREGRITGGLIAWRDISRLRLTERQLKSMAEYRLALDAARIGTWTYDPASDLVTMDERCSALFGLEHLEERDFADLAARRHPDDRGRVEEAIFKALAPDSTGEYEEEYRVLWPDGSVHWIASKGVTLFQGEGASRRAVRSIGTAMDVTERRKVEEAVRGSEARFRGTFENAAVGMALIAADGHWLQVNRKLCDMVGYTPEEMREKTFSDITHPEDLREGLRQAERLLHGEIEHYRLEKRYLHKDGHQFWVQLTKTLQRGADGAPLFFIAVIEDISRRKAAEQELQQSEERLSMALQSARMGVWELNLGDHRAIRSLEHDRIFGYEVLLPEWTYELFLHHVVPEDRAEVDRQFRAALSGDKVWHFECRIRRADGAIRWIEAQGRQNPDETRMVGLVTDITARKEVEEALRIAKEAAEAASRARDTFLVNMSHELRTPLTVNMGVLELARQAPDCSEETGLLLAEASRAAESLLFLIQDILDFRALQNGEIAPADAPFDLLDCCRQATELTGGAARKKGLQFRVDLDPGLPLRVRGDCDRLYQVLVNLIGNAVKFSQRGGIEVGIRRGEEAADRRTQIFFHVRDTGDGIPAAMIRTIFEPFAQADQSLTRRHGGAGLGLAIARGLIEKMGGQIHVESEEGKGSSFSFHLPLRVLTDPSPPADRTSGRRRLEESAPGGAAGRLLLVEDDEQIVDFLTLMLARQGWQVEVAGNGRRALEMLEAQGYNIVLMDVKMPVMDGLEATRQLRQRERDRRTPVIALTAHAREVDQRRCLEAGMDDFLAKPLNMSRLFATIDRYRPGPV